MIKVLSKNITLHIFNLIKGLFFLKLIYKLSKRIEKYIYMIIVEN